MVTSKQISLVVLGGLFLIACLVATLICVPKIEVFGWDQLLHPHKISPAFYKRDVFAQEDRARQTLATILGGLAVLAGAYMTWQNLQLSRRVAKKNAKTAQKNIKIAEDKLITDRFTAAVNNLSTEGPDKMAVRLGGIYALKRIANDSPQDHWTVMEVLTAYIRDKCPKLKGEELAAAENYAGIHGPVEKVLPTDIEAVVTIIRERSANSDGYKRLDLHEADLAGANLRGARLRRGILWGAILDGADLLGAVLAGANLSGASLARADLREAALGGAMLAEAHLGGAILGGADLATCFNLTQQQLDSADQAYAPESLPPGLTFPGYVDPNPSN